MHKKAFDIHNYCVMKEEPAMELKVAFLQILPGNSTDENMVIEIWTSEEAVRKSVP